jgi:hypothetical protein
MGCPVDLEATGAGYDMLNAGPLGAERHRAMDIVGET